MFGKKKKKIDDEFIEDFEDLSDEELLDFLDDDSELTKDEIEEFKKKQALKKQNHNKKSKSGKEKGSKEKNFSEKSSKGKNLDEKNPKERASKPVSKKSSGTKDTQIIELKTTFTTPVKILIWLIVLLIIFGAGYFVLNTKLKTKSIVVKGNTWHTDQQVIDHLKSSKIDEYAFLFKLHYVFKDPEKMAFVEKFSIDTKGADVVEITVYEKKIVGCVYEMNDYLYFDKDGYVISNAPELSHDIPRIEGLDYTSLTIGQKLEVSNEAIFDIILNVTQLIDKYKVGVEVIEFDSKFQVTLMCTDGNKVYLGKHDRYDDMISALPQILKAAEAKGEKYWMDMSEFTPTSNSFISKYLDPEGKPMEKPVEPLPTPEVDDDDDSDYDDDDDDSDYDDDDDE